MIRSPEEVIASYRRPKIIFTEAYLNDPIRFERDFRLDPEILVRQANMENVASRDYAEFLYVNLNSTTPAQFAVSMISPLYFRHRVAQHIDREFRELMNNA